MIYISVVCECVVSFIGGYCYSNALRIIVLKSCSQLLMEYGVSEEFYSNGLVLGNLPVQQTIIRKRSTVTVGCGPVRHKSCLSIIPK